MQLMNGPDAVAHALRACGVQCVIGHGNLAKTVQALMTEQYRPEILDLHGESAISAAAARTLACQRCLIEGAQELKSLALARMPVVCTAPEPKNWSIALAPQGASFLLQLGLGGRWEW